MILLIRESNINRKFDIKINVNENMDNLNEKCECEICHEENENKNFVKLNCGHEFCKDCIKKSLQNEKKVTPCCALCRGDITNFDVYEESIKNEFNELIK
jgi:late competence protein required for DNA uptake (superfamily II DNA/RNA helicase)